MSTVTGGPRIVRSGLVLDLDASSANSYGPIKAEVLVVAGGGGGGMDMGGGGGGGGVLYSSSYAITRGSTITVTVGNGGYGAPAAGTYRGDGAGPQNGGHQYNISATQGGNSVFGSLTAIGGGFGGSSYFGYTPNYGYGGSGGSGGGASGYSDGSAGRAGTGTSGQGFNGGGSSGQYYSGGGGGAGGVGVSGSNKPNGGPGVLYPTMSQYYFGGGGGGAAYSLSSGGDGGIGGGGGGAVGVTVGGAGLNNGSAGGGGSPNSQTNTPGGNAGANTGGGGGGGSHYNSNNKGGDGGSGIVIIRYKGPQKATGGTVTTVGSETVHTFTSSGTFVTGTNFIDLSGNGNNGSLVNGVGYSGTNGGSLSFDGINQRVSTNYKPSGERSYFIWVKFSSLTHSSGYQLTGTQESNSYTYIGIQNGGDVYYYAGASTGGNIGNPVTVNTWVNLGFALFPDGSRRVYKNGIEIHYNTGGLGGTATLEFSVGCINQNHFITGNISNVTIYNRALSASEIMQNFQATKSRFGL